MLLLFALAYIQDNDKVVYIIEKAVPLATLATIALGIIQLNLNKLPLEATDKILASSIGLASWGGRFILWGTVLFIIYIIIKEIISKLEKGKISHKEFIIDSLTPAYISLKISIPILFFASIYLLLNSFLIVIRIN